MHRSESRYLVERAREGDREAFGEESLDAWGAIPPHRMGADNSVPELEHVVADAVGRPTLRWAEDSANGGSPCVPGTP